MTENLSKNLKELQEKALSYGASATKIVDISTILVALAP